MERKPAYIVKLFDLTWQFLGFFQILICSDFEGKYNDVIV